MLCFFSSSIICFSLSLGFSTINAAFFALNFLLFSHKRHSFLALQTNLFCHLPQLQQICHFTGSYDHLVGSVNFMINVDQMFRPLARSHWVLQSLVCSFSSKFVCHLQDEIFDHLKDPKYCFLDLNFSKFKLIRRLRCQGSICLIAPLGRYIHQIEL